MSSESTDQVNEEEVHQLFNLIDTERTGYITPTVRFKQTKHLLIHNFPFQQAWKAGELIRERFGVDEVSFLELLEFPVSCQWRKSSDSVFL